MKNYFFKYLFLIMCISAPFLYLYKVYEDMPPSVALHYGLDMKPDRFGDKSELWTTILIMMGIALVVYLIITNIGKLDPKNQDLQSSDMMQKLGLTVIAFISIMVCYIIYSSLNSGSGNMLFVLLGGFFAVLGNFLHSVKPNYFVGFRLPWTLENDETWRKTHQLASKIWVIGGLLIAGLSLMIPASYMIIIFIVIILIMVIIPSVYSYRDFQQRNKLKNINATSKIKLS